MDLPDKMLSALRYLYPVFFIRKAMLYVPKNEK